MSRLFDQDDPDVFELRPERRTLPKLAVVFVFLLAVVGIAGYAVHDWYVHQINPAGRPGAAVTVVIPKGTTITGAGSLLASRHVIGSSTVFRFWVRSKAVKVQAGTYHFHEHSSFDEAVGVLRKGPIIEPVSRVTIPEGFTLAQIGERLTKLDPRFSSQALESALVDPTLSSPYRPATQQSWEGMLFPSTYDIGTKDTARTLISRMAAEMQVVGTKLGLGAGPVGGADRVPKLTPYQVLTVASLIQAEMGNPGEAPKIARVIYNRLLAGMPLGIDATSRYLARQTGTSIDFASPSPYNTRRQKGLPPTPIDAPGETAIAGALHPADGTWLYYVLEAKGRHFFTVSVAEFNAKKKECEAKGLGCG